MKYYLIAGEASGDLHGSNLMREIDVLDNSAVMRCWGGEKMEDAGGTLVKHYRDLAFMGFTEVVKNLPAILKNFKACKKDILAFKPDALVLIDYPGFNLRLARWAKRMKIPVMYYISPQVWAWNSLRVFSMRKNINKLMVILPFEKGYFWQKWKWMVDYVGHPLVDEIEKNQRRLSGKPQISTKPIVAVLPGSRKQEISTILPIMLSVSTDFPDYQFIVAKAPGVEESFYDNMLKSYPNATAVAGQTYLLLSQAKAAMVTSGTATLETALFNVPQVVCYKGSRISYEIGKMLVRVKYISLVNLIMDKMCIKELIQKDLTQKNLRKELDMLLHDHIHIKVLKNDYYLTKKVLSDYGNGSATAANIIVNYLNEKVLSQG